MIAELQLSIWVERKVVGFLEQSKHRLGLIRQAEKSGDKELQVSEGTRLSLQMSFALSSHFVLVLFSTQNEIIYPTVSAGLSNNAFHTSQLLFMHQCQSCPVKCMG
jgi:hypothetical protein